MSSPLPFSSWQITLLRCLTPFPASLSIIGSLLICRNVWISSQSSNLSTYQRFILGLSVSDILTSFRMIVSSIFLRPFLQPSAVCSAEGFWITMGFSGPFYNAAINFNFLVTICSMRRESKLSQTTEILLHVLSIGCPLVSAIAGIPLQVFNPESSDIGCWAQQYPFNCSGNDCLRGRYAGLYGYIVGIVPLLLIWIFLIGSNLTIYCYVRRLVRKTMRYTLPEHAQTSNTIRTSSLSIGAPPSSTELPPHAPTPVSKTQMVATQSFLYVFAYFVCFIWSLALAIAETADQDGFQSGCYFFLNVLQYTFYPSQGIFNALVFCRPTYMRMRRSHHSRVQCLQSALFPAWPRASTEEESDAAKSQEAF